MDRAERRAITGAEQMAALRPKLLESLALRRAHRGRVVKSGDHYYDRSWPMPGYLTETLNRLTDTGFLALAEEDQWCRREVKLTGNGHTKHAELCQDTPPDHHDPG
ncbi:MAG TPA: hypothetical protein VFO16_02160 [Pseudonocardiaceae bacterium]|nr:hypothetical protein [Pseudonocardiaceae bacterium]